MTAKDYVYCTTCGAKVSATAKFCRFCGNKIKRPAKTNNLSLIPSSTPRDSVVNEKPVVTTPIQTTIPTEATIAMDDTIPDEVLNILYSRQRINGLKQERKKLLSEVDQIQKKVEVGLLGDLEAGKSIEEIKNRLNKLNNEEKELVRGELEIEKLYKEKNKLSEILGRLEEKKRAGAVSNEVYSKLHKEYSTNLSQIERKFDVEERKARRWLVQLRKDVTNLKAEIESLEVRGELENLGDEVKNKINDLKEERVRKSIAADVLGKLIDSL